MSRARRARGQYGPSAFKLLLAARAAVGVRTTSMYGLWKTLGASAASSNAMWALYSAKTPARVRFLVSYWTLASAWWHAHHEPHFRRTIYVTLIIYHEASIFCTPKSLNQCYGAR